MKKLGLIGGIGPESTLLYYRKFVYEAHRLMGDTFFPELTIESLNVYDVLALCDKKDHDGLVSYLMRGIGNLVAAGAEVVALTGNTPHIVFDELQKRSDVPLVSIVEAARDEARRRHFSRVGLLGTRFTMEADFFKKPFRESHIEVVTPTASEIEFIAEKISTELEKGVVRELTRTIFLGIVERMKQEQGIEAIVLGCTELPLLFEGVSLPVESLDTLEIHIGTLIKTVMAS